MLAVASLYQCTTVTSRVGSFSLCTSHCVAYVMYFMCSYDLTHGGKVRRYGSIRNSPAVRVVCLSSELNGQSYWAECTVVILLDRPHSQSASYVIRTGIIVFAVFVNG